jgi:UDP-N-acetyl-2-amino-2-deoxyglucuronate dehydrogenase
MLVYVFGDVKDNIVHYSAKNKVAGYFEFNQSRVCWFFSIDHNDFPIDIKQSRQRTYRSITIDNLEIEISGGFTDLHTESYHKIQEGKGFRLDEARQSINTVFHIRNSVQMAYEETIIRRQGGFKMFNVYSLSGLIP